MQRQAPGMQELESSAMLRFNDIPYPAGFKILADRSFILESGGVRAGVLRYTGKADAESVVCFYKTRMPSYNWALLNVLEFGDRMLNFERQNESCVVTIKSKGKGVEISVSLAPKSPMPVPTQKKEEKEPAGTSIRQIK
jgi:hypothetical protein